MNNQRVYLLIIVSSLLLVLTIYTYATNETPLPGEIAYTLLFLVLPKLLIEYGLIKLLTKSSVKRAIVIDIVMNLGPLLLGNGLLLILFRVLYLVFWFLKAKVDISIWIHIGPVFLLLVTILVYGLIEKFTIEKVFKDKIGKKGFWWLVFTNSISIGLYFVLPIFVGNLLM